MRRTFFKPARVVESIGLTGSERVLELGPGPGFYSVEIARRLRGGRLDLFDRARPDRRPTGGFQLPRPPALLGVAADRVRCDIKTAQARMRHATARTTLDTYGHLWPDADESTRTAVGAVIADRLTTAAVPLRSEAPNA